MIKRTNCTHNDLNRCTIDFSIISLRSLLNKKLRGFLSFEFLKLTRLRRLSFTAGVIKTHNKLNKYLFHTWDLSPFTG